VAPGWAGVGTLAVMAVAPGLTGVGAELMDAGLAIVALIRCVGRRWVPAGLPCWRGRHRTPGR
jgi:hypothetical protein